MYQKREERIREKSITSYKIVEVKFYEFIAVIDNKRLKVIVKQIGEGNKYFWSIIPFWKKGVEGRVLHSLYQD